MTLVFELDLHSGKVHQRAKHLGQKDI